MKFPVKQQHGRSHKHSSGKDQKHKRYHGSKATAATPENNLRFLFVVNELTIDPTYNQRPVDCWLNDVPPSSPSAYGHELIGRVFQYDGGHVSLAQDCVWYRPRAGVPGNIGRHGPDGSFGIMVPYKTSTVFACSPHLPIVVAECDVSCDPAFIYRPDCTCNNTAEGLPEPTRWNILSFDKYQGFTQANAIGRESPYVLGRNPSWIPALVPKIFQNPDENAPRSTGLGGDLATLIGLMAFHGGRGRASDVFAGGAWQQNRWHGSTHTPHSCKLTLP